MFHKNIFVAHLIGSQYLFQIIQTSLTVKIRENVVQSEIFEKDLRWRATNCFRNDGNI